MPAEWEPHEATWLVWPHNRKDWPAKLAPIPWVYGEIARKIAPGEAVRIIVMSKAHEAGARRVLERAGINLEKVQFFRFATDRAWFRDSGPIFVKKDGPPAEVAAANFRFNAWAKYAEYKRDNRLPERTKKALGMKGFKAVWEGREIVLEGGSIDVNGRGSLLTTEECLLDQKVQVRNPGLGRKDMAAIFAAFLGVKNVIWLGRGIVGDDTHGHVDDLCRFVNEKTIVICREKNPRDANYRALEVNWERLHAAKLEDGSTPEIVALPMPAPLVFDGLRLPASYANFYITNTAVLVPTFNDPADRLALGILGELFPQRQVVGIHAVDLVWGLGTLHCLTQQQPAAR
ncbi:MAG: agmatine deiminase family protein [Planctomycetota bacterium]|nr:agmatine deiminase family protein [Planctomycetota bacterium]